jgi:pimeloyl-ACP methyl ester carboxylesterase
VAVRYIQRETPPPDAGPADDDLKKFNEAQARAMPVHRLLDNGVEYSDAMAFHKMAAANVPWAEAGEWLGRRNLDRAAAARTDGFRQAERIHLLHACACFRFAQSAYVFDEPEKLRLYRLVIDCFADGVALLDAPPARVEVPHAGGALCGWLFRPPGIERPPVVIVFGGADGWRESYYPMVSYLQAQGLAVCLLDGPGQGETRLFRKVYLDAGYIDGFAAAAQSLRRDPSLGDRVGLWGNSLGGTFAAAVSAACPEIDACCSNGGSAEPAEVLDRYPRFLDRIAAMMGHRDRDAAERMMRDLDLRERLHGLECPLLVLHGGNDRLFSETSVKALHDCSGSADREMVVWDDGDHCLYNHAAERNLLVAGWFAQRLRDRTGIVTETSMRA